LEARAEGSPLTVQLGVRPSGTEPKIKFYYFAQAEVTDPGLLDQTKEEAFSTIEDFKAALMDWIDQTLANT